MSDKQLEQRLDKNPKRTEYRIVENRTFIADKFLQFESNKKKINFLNLRNPNQVKVWRYIPTEDNYISEYLCEDNCPTSIFLGSEGKYVSCIQGMEHMESSEIMQFIKKYQDIQNYFDHFNQLREQYLQKKIKNNIVGTILLSE